MHSVAAELCPQYPPWLFSTPHVPRGIGAGDVHVSPFLREARGSLSLGQPSFLSAHAAAQPWSTDLLALLGQIAESIEGGVASVGS